ncbi:hypothetical protein ACLOJK_028751 [Asimina triloba]
MAAAATTSLKWNPLILIRPIPRHCHHHHHHHHTPPSLSPSKPPKPYLSIKCSHSPQYRPSPNPFHALLGAVSSTLKSLQKPAIAAVLLAALLAYDPHSALAASGGRMGGRSFSSSSSSSSSSRSYSAPPSARSEFSYSIPFSSSAPFLGGGGFYVAPAFGFGVGAGSGFFLLMSGFAAAILVSGFLSDRSDDGSVLTDTRKTSVLKLQVGLLGLARSLQKDLDRIAETANTSTSEGLNYVLTGRMLDMFVFKSLLDFFEFFSWIKLREKKKIPVVLLLLNFSSINCCNRQVPSNNFDLTVGSSIPGFGGVFGVMGEKIEETIRRGLKMEGYFETALALLRHPDSCISGYSSDYHLQVTCTKVDVKRSMEDGEKRFNQLSIEERGKFDEETLVNVNNIKRQSTTSHRLKSFSNEYIVVRALSFAVFYKQNFSDR